ncbi:MAG: hypothetical protein GX608_10070 [Lentisphaerae bacterium]|nr:hypothetical protein [Lentisphaerota bacterium]
MVTDDKKDRNLTLDDVIMNISFPERKQAVFLVIMIFISYTAAIPGNSSESNLTNESQHTNNSTRFSNEQIASNKMLVAEFAANAKCKQIPGVPRPQLPDVPADICQAIEVLREMKDQDVIADVAAVLVRYARMQEKYGTGAQVSSKHPLTMAFMSSMNPVIPGDEIISSSLADWICKNRNKMGQSVALDKEIGEYNKSRKRLQIKYEKMQQEALKSIGDQCP